MMLQVQRWECFHCEDGFHLRPGICQTCGVEFRLVPLLPEA